MTTLIDTLENGYVFNSICRNKLSTLHIQCCILMHKQLQVDSNLSFDKENGTVLRKSRGSIQSLGVNSYHHGYYIETEIKLWDLCSSHYMVCCILNGLCCLYYYKYY